jgi:hypothetical protein
VLQWFILLPRVLAFVSWDWYRQTRFYRRWFIIPLRCILLGAVLHSGACQGRVWHHPTTRRRWRRRAELVLQPHGEFRHHAAAKFEGRGGHFVGARRCQRAAPQYLYAVTVFLAPSSGSSTPSSGDEKETTTRRRVKGKGSRCSHKGHGGRHAKVAQMERSGTSGGMEAEAEVAARGREMQWHDSVGAWVRRVMDRQGLSVFAKKKDPKIQHITTRSTAAITHPRWAIRWLHDGD